MSKYYGIVTGGFDPLHSEHVKMIYAAAMSCDSLWIGVNSDAWLLRKKGYVIMPYANRVNLLQQIMALSHFNISVTNMNDEDDTAIDLIENLTKNARYADPSAKITFFNGGDRTKENIPEAEICHQLNVDMVFNCGNTPNSEHGREFMKQTVTQLKQHTERPWGYYEVLDKGLGYKVKKLVVEPGQSLSMQRHFHREEHWTLVSGNGVVEALDEKGSLLHLVNQAIQIDIGAWHRLYNPGKIPLVMIEVQKGEYTEEDDIERKE